MKDETTQLRGSISRNQQYFLSELKANNSESQQLFRLKNKVYLPATQSTHIPKLTPNSTYKFISKQDINNRSTVDIKCISGRVLKIPWPSLVASSGV